MSRKLTMLTSAALLGATLVAPAPAQAIDMRCQIKVSQYCSANWQALGFYSELECYWYWDEAACRQYPPQPWDPNWPYLPPVGP
jgi:hypothetical protein